MVDRLRRRRLRLPRHSLPPRRRHRVLLRRGHSTLCRLHRLLPLLLRHRRRHHRRCPRRRREHRGHMRSALHPRRPRLRPPLLCPCRVTLYRSPRKPHLHQPHLHRKCNSIRCLARAKADNPLYHSRASGLVVDSRERRHSRTMTGLDSSTRRKTGFRRSAWTRTARLIIWR